MSDRFWHWVARTDARWVLAGSLLAAVALVLAWSLQRQSAQDLDINGTRHPVPSEETPPAPVTASARGPIQPPGLPETPFTSAYLRTHLAEKERQRPARTEAERSRAIQTEAKPAQDTAKTITLLYRGMITRTDGVTVALIETVGSGSAMAYELDDAIAAFRITRISRDEVALASADLGNPVLAIGRPETLEY